MGNVLNENGEVFACNFNPALMISIKVLSGKQSALQVLYVDQLFTGLRAAGVLM